MAQSELKFVAVCVFLMYGLHCTVAAEEDLRKCPPGTTTVVGFLRCLGSVAGGSAVCAHPAWVFGWSGYLGYNHATSFTLDAIPALHNGCASITRTDPLVATLPDSKNACFANAKLCVDNTDRNAAFGGTSDSSESR